MRVCDKTLPIGEGGLGLLRAARDICVLPVLSCLGLGIAVIGIGGAYGRVMETATAKRVMPATES